MDHSSGPVPRLDTKAHGAEPAAGRSSGALVADRGRQGRTGTLRSRWRCGPTQRWGPGGGPGPADIKAATGVTVAADAGLGQSPAPARSSVDLGTTTMCRVRRGQGGVRADIRFRLTQTGVSGDITEYLLLQGSRECAVEESCGLSFNSA